jgi:hypothetical protein
VLVLTMEHCGQQQRKRCDECRATPAQRLLCLTPLMNVAISSSSFGTTGMEGSL